MDWHGAHDRGATMAENRRGLIAAHPDKADLIRAWDARWDEMFDGWVAGMDALFTELDAAGVAQYGLSNLPAEKWRPLLDLYPELERLRETVVSGAEGVAKPDPRIYAITAERIGHRPDETLFVDDKAENVAAAAEAGFPGLVFTDAAKTRAALREAGLPV
ncbi:HAD family hydrolase [Marinicauda salina]|uniref:HAD family hydrolase n=2 Tax=Marinicauda salina TaxID=2135793 RepID=A0A2U2BY58_9PROT|nr:HAD family hydrolase [Marinicauda salina]